MIRDTALNTQGLLNSVDNLTEERVFEIYPKIHRAFRELSQSKGLSFVEWLFGLSRQLFLESKPIATEILSGALVVELFFMKSHKIFQQAQRRNPPMLEVLIWNELKNRLYSGRLAVRTLWRIAACFRSEILRSEFLFWFSNRAKHFELSTILNLRSHLALKLRSEGPGRPEELEIIDETIKLRIVTSDNGEIRRLCNELRMHPLVIPEYFWPLCEKLFPHPPRAP